METTSEEQQERISVPSNSKSRADFYIYLLAVMNAIFAIGVYLSWTSVGLSHFIEVHIIDHPKQGVWASCLLPFGAVLGSLPVGILADKYGRKYVTWFSTMLLVFGWFIICFVQTRDALYAARFIAGVGCGAISVVAPMYLYELSHSEYQENIVHIVHECLNFGIWWPFIVGTYAMRAKEHNVEQSDRPQILITGAFSFLTIFILLLPESPLWLEDRGKKEEAEKAITKLTGSYVSLNGREPIKVTGNSGLRLSALETIRNKRNIFLIMGFITIQQLTGIGPMTFYLKGIFDYIVRNNVAFWVYSFITLAPAIMAGPCNIILHRYIGEKILLITSTCLMSIFGTLLAGLAYCRQAEVILDNTPFRLVSTLSIIIYLMAYSMGLGPVPWIMIGKMFPSNSRKAMYNLAVTYSWVLLFITTETCLDALMYIGLVCTLLMYVFISLIGVFLAICIVPRKIDEIEREILVNLEENYTGIESSDY